MLAKWSVASSPAFSHPQFQSHALASYRQSRGAQNDLIVALCTQTSQKLEYTNSVVHGGLETVMSRVWVLKKRSAKIFIHMCTWAKFKVTC